jgi:hypothetical protein
MSTGGAMRTDVEHCKKGITGIVSKGDKTAADEASLFEAPPVTISRLVAHARWRFKWRGEKTEGYY